MSLPEYALSLRAIGIQAAPAKPLAHESKGKAPNLPAWERLKESYASDQEAGAWDWSTGRVGAFLGEVSGGLQCLDFDIPEKNDAGYIVGSVEPPLYAPWRELVESFYGGSELLARLYIERTASGGIHCYFRCSAEVPEKKKNLAKVHTPRRKPEYTNVIEHLSRGQYSVCAPTPAYVPLQGTLADSPEITGDELELLVECARMLCREPKTEHTPRHRAPRPSGAPEEGLPGEDFNRRGSWEEALPGWTFTGRIWRGCELLTRPGKSEGVSASVGMMDLGERLFVFTTSTELEPDHVYTKFGAYAALVHGGDYAAAARALSSMGYGETPTEKLKKTVRGTKPAAPIRVKPLSEVKSGIEAILERLRAQSSPPAVPQSTEGDDLMELARQVFEGLEHPSESPEVPFPPCPPHLKSKVLEWTRDSARSWAWKEWVQLKEEERPSPMPKTLEGCVEWILREWAKGKYPGQ